MLPVLMLCFVVGSPALRGETVFVVATGEVEFNGIAPGALGGVGVGESVAMTFELESDDFVDSAGFPTRGYAMSPGSFSLAFDSTVMELQDPFPAGQTPYFVIRNDDPAVDGFFVSTSVDFPAGVPISQIGVFGPFVNNYSVTYGGTTLSSLDILDALGTYDFSGLTVFNWTIDDGPFNAMGLVIEELTISVAPGDPVFRRGDANADGLFDISDAVYTLAALFTAGAPSPSCADSADSNDDGSYDISDAIHTLAALFTAGSPSPPDPGPTDCDLDPTADGLDCALYDAGC